MQPTVLFSVKAICVAIYIVGSFGVTRAQSNVSLHIDSGSHQLVRNGKPFDVHGVGGDGRLEMLRAAGGNSIRTWSTDNLEQILDDAHKHKLSVCIGLWLGHTRHGFDYQNESAVLKQLTACEEAVRRFKDHPAVLMWGIGNEMEGDGLNPAIWYAIDHIARACKQIDPNHPTMTVIAELGDHKLQSIERFCPNIDIIGVNSYGGMATLAERYRAAGGTKPYIVTEHGPLGPWEVEKTEWDAPLEASSTAKAAQYAGGFRKTVIDQAGLCLGSFAFLWGDKQETTATWFGMMLPDGTRLAAIDAMSEAWTAKPPQNRCPQIESLTLERTSRLKPGDSIRAVLRANDPEDDTLSTKWILRSDSGTIGVGGDFQSAESTLTDAVSGDSTNATLTIPKGGGGYRLFAYVFDGHGGAAVANVPLWVDAPIMKVASPKTTLPYTVYSENETNAPYAASGYMGNTQAIEMVFDSHESPHSGLTCLKVQYTAADDWGGVLWQSPSQDWDGNQPGGLDLNGADALEFWVRGAEGGEKISFVLGALDGDQPYSDSAKAELPDVRLTLQWQQLRIPLDDRDLSRIKTGFGWSIAGQGKPVTFFLDDIRYTAQ